MKYKLSRPKLSSYDIARLNFYAAYIGYNFKFDIKKGSALFETPDKDIGYIQKDNTNHLFVVWKSSEITEYIDKSIEICIKLDYHNVINDTLDKFKMAIGINNICGCRITKKMMNYIKRYENG